MSSSQEAATQLPLFVHRSGSGGTPCVLIHGLGDGAYVWTDFVRHLPADYQALAVDLRGHGYSPRSAGGQYFTHQHVADVTATLDRLGLERPVLIGHSLGGDVAMRIAIAQPQRIAALVIVDFGPESGPSGMRVIHNLKHSMREYATVQEYLRWLTRTRPMISAELLEHCAVESLEGSAEGGFRLRVDPAIFWANAPHRNPKIEWAALASIACPTLLLRGAASAVLPKAVAEKMAAAVPDCTLLEVSKSGHAIMLENPGAFRQCVCDFLNRLREGVAAND